MGLFNKLFKKAEQSNEINCPIQENIHKSSNSFDEINNKEQLFNAIHNFTYRQFIDYKPYQFSEEQKIVIFLNWCNKSKKALMDNDKYPQWISCKLKIYDINNYHKKIIDFGYLEKASNEYNLSKLTVNELNKILEKNNITTKGKKSVLVKVILDTVDIDTLQLKTYYQLSEKGIQLLNTTENKEFTIVFENNYNVDLAEFYNVKKYLSEYSSTNDILWQTLIAKYDYEKLNNNFGLARNICMNEAFFLKDEQKLSSALEHFIYVAYFDLSGCTNGYILEKEKSKIAPAVISYIQELSSHYDDRMIKRCKALYLPHHYYSIDEFYTIIKSIMDNSNYYKQFTI